MVLLMHRRDAQRFGFPSLLVKHHRPYKVWSWGLGRAGARALGTALDLPNPARDRAGALAKAEAGSGPVDHF